MLKCNEIASVFLPDYQWRWLPAHGAVCCASVATLTTLGIWQGSKCSSPARKNVEANPFRERLVAERVAMGWLHRGFLSLSFPKFSWERKGNIRCGLLLLLLSLWCEMLPWLTWSCDLFVVSSLLLCNAEEMSSCWYASLFLWCHFPWISYLVEVSSKSTSSN